MLETLIAGALFGAVVPSFIVFNLLMSNMEKKEKIRLLETKIETFENVLGAMKKKEF